LSPVQAASSAALSPVQEGDSWGVARFQDGESPGGDIGPSGGVRPSENPPADGGRAGAAAAAPKSAPAGRGAAGAALGRRRPLRLRGALTAVAGAEAAKSVDSADADRPRAAVAARE
jgi:hypothetical protein